MAVDHARVMVLIFSSNTNESRQVSREVERAVSQGVTIIPLRIEQAIPARSLAYFMAGVHWLDAMTPPIEQHLQTLARSITALLQAAPGDEEGGGVHERRFRAPVVRRQSRRRAIIILVLMALIAAGVGAAIVRSGWLKQKPAEEAITPPTVVPPAEPGHPPTAAKQEGFHPTVAFTAPTPPAPAAPSPPEPRPPPVPSPPPTPSPMPTTPAVTTLYDGVWRGVRDCVAWEGRPALQTRLSMTIHNGRASSATKFAVDTPGYLTFQGSVEVNGGLLVTGYGISGGLAGGLPRGQRYVFDFQGTISGDVFNAKQVGLPRPCTLTLNRQH